jgi:penicillin-insensitive murein DD-endopeptidase
MLFVKNNVVLRAIAAFACAATLLAVQLHAQTATDQKTLGQLAATQPPKIDINKIPAKKLFGGEVTPANLAARAIGNYSRGCLSGAKALPVNGEAWQVMRTSRNRNWGHPSLLNLIERLAIDAKKNDGWNGLLVGDISQPRGGPMLTGHASHQIGLDADVWFTPMPDHVLTTKERENLVPLEMVKDHKTLNTANWTESRAKLIRTAAQYPEVARIFVHPPIKAELCKWATGDRSWLAKVRPLYGHTFHFHIRMNCPAGMKGCENQWKPAPKDGTGCGEELAYWMGPVPWTPHKPKPGAPPYVPPPPLTLSGLPAECRAVVAAP